MRNIKYVVAHCVAAPIRHVLGWYTEENERILINNMCDYWRNELKWRHCGYHYIAMPSGRIYKLADISHPTNGVRGYNSESVHVAYYGGLTRSDVTAPMMAAWYIVLHSLGVALRARVVRHRDLANKNCPNIDAQDFYRDLAAIKKSCNVDSRCIILNKYTL